jgi:alcohol dehydrogenase
MKAIVYQKFRGPLTMEDVDLPPVDDDGVLVEVGASGICRSDWHGWLGHDPDINTFPHVPGHELAGVVAECGSNVNRWKKGDRVTVPFVCGCGTCPECESGNHQVCDHQTQPGFTHWGSFAQFVAIHHADVNLVRLPDEMTFVTAASLGCRFATAFRAVVEQGRVAAGEWVAVHGCGGVGMSAIMVASALGARVVAIDIDHQILELAQSVGAEEVVDASNGRGVVDLIHQKTGRGAHVSIDALGSSVTCANSILSLRKRGRHVQVGLLAGDDHRPRLPMEHVIGKELEIVGSHGMQASRYGEMFEMIASGKLDPERIIGKRVSLEDAPDELLEMGSFGGAGITVIDRF